MTEAIIEYYAEDSLSTIFHDLLARLETGAAKTMMHSTHRYCKPPARILELGCGPGRPSFALSKRGHWVEGIDIAEAMLGLAKLQLSRLEATWAERVNFTLSDKTSFSLPGKFDLIIAPYSH